METRRIFLDTEVFRGAGFNFRSGNLHRIVEYVQKHNLQVYLTDVTVREIESKIREDVQSARRAAKKFRKQAYILSNVVSPALWKRFWEFDEEIFVRKVLRSSRSFLEKAHVTILPSISEESAERVFDLYFEKHPPFGEGKNKAEFPDAFVLDALKGLCSREKEKIYVVTHDGAWKDACSKANGLLYIESIKKIFDTISRQQDLSEWVLSRLEDRRQELEALCKESFQEAGFYLEDQDGDVYDVTVHDCELGEPFILEMNAERAVCGYEASFSYSVEVSYDDPDTIVYFSREWIQKTLERSTLVECELEVSFDPHEDSSFKVDSVSAGGDHAITVFEYLDRFYK